MGSYAYGVSTDTSDVDVYGICVPPRNYVLPENVIYGFDTIPVFETYQQHGIRTSTKEYDLNIFNIVKFFKLAADGNPNIIDTLYTPAHCLLHCTQIGEIIRDNRSMFLTRKTWHTFKGYAYSQLSKLRHKNPQNNARAESVQKYGYDLKYAYHLVRLLGEAEQIATTQHIDLTLDAERLKAIRAGQWTVEDVERYFTEKEHTLEQAFDRSPLPYQPDLDKIRQVLVDCLTIHYGTLPIQADEKVCYTSLQKIKSILGEVGL
jgi:predicted nucleotidyltransferase